MSNQSEIKAIVLEFINNHYSLHERLNKSKNEHKINYDKELYNFDEWFTPCINKIGMYYYQSSDNKEQIQIHLNELRFNRILKEATYLKQTIEKPYGYAGDFKTMELIYENGYDGTTPFGEFYNRATTSVSSCAGVRHRKSLLRSLLLETNGSCLSVAAGPGREILEAFEAGFKGKVKAIDADIDALRHFKGYNLPIDRFQYWIANVFHLLKGRDTIVKPKEHHISKAKPKDDLKGVKKILFPINYDKANFKSEKYDLIYSAGLFDYIKTFSDNKAKGAIGLTKILFDQVKEGGRLVIGVMTTDMPIGQKFFMEAICEWEIIFRDREELLEFAEGINQEEVNSIEIINGHENIQAYLVITKK